MFKVARRYKLWILLVFGLIFISLLASAKTYLSSVNREEVKIAQIGGVTTNPYNLTGFSGKGKLKIYERGWGYPITFKIKHNGSNYSYQVHNDFVKTNVEAGKGDSVKITTYFPANYKPYGWKKPGSDTRNCALMIQGFLDTAESNKETVVSKQCWNDDNEGDDPYDDFAVVITQILDTDPGPGEEDKVKFVIRAFNDEDKDRDWDSDESSLGVEVEFEYRISGTDWKEYTTDADSGWGKIVKAGIDSKVEVKGENIDGYILTVDSPKVKILDEEKIYYFDFGYVIQSDSSPEPSPSLIPIPSPGPEGNFPPTQPDTGTSTWLTVGAMVLGLGLIIARKQLG